MKPSKPVWCNYGQNPAPLHVPPKAFVHPKCFNLLTYISLHLPRARCFFKCPISKKNGASIFHSTSWFETFRKQLKYPPIPKTSQLESQGQWNCKNYANKNSINTVLCHQNGGQQKSLWWTFKQNRKLSEIINMIHFLESMWIRTQIKRWWLKRISNYEGHALIPPTANIKHVTKLQHLKSPSEFPYNLLNFNHQNTISFGGAKIGHPNWEQ